MIQKSVFPDEPRLPWRAVRRPLAAGIMAVVGIAGLLMLIVEMDATTPDPPTTPHTAAPASGKTDPVDPPQTAEAHSTVPGEWLINDVAKTRAKPEATQPSPDPVPVTAAAADAHLETRAGSPLPSDTRLGGDEHGPRSPAGAIARVDTSRPPDDAATSCLEGPVGQAPEGKRWSYHIDREGHRKCWYLRARKHERSPRSAQHQRWRRTWANWGPWDLEW
jgi:hypothetical protein